MKRFTEIVLGASFILISATAPLKDAEIKMKSLSYDPKQIDIVQGQSVVWKNTAFTDHSASSEDVPVLFDTGMISPGKSSRPIVFNKLGTFKFHCALHGETMTGSITVKAPSN